MKKKYIGLLVVLCISSFLFTACERSASGAPVVVPTATQDEIPFPVATQPQIMADILKSTQTALAKSTQSAAFPSAATSTPGFTLNTPTGGTQPAIGGEGTPAIGTTPSPMAATSTSAPTATATQAVPSYPTPTPGHPATYTIQAGEYLWCLARRFDVSIDDIYSLNGMNYASQPPAGTVITLPASGSFGATRARYPHPTNYTVRAGDTIGSIACYYGDADPNTIYAANGLQPGSVITVGQVLYIP